MLVIFVSYCITTLKRPKIETISLEEIGIPRVTSPSEGIIYAYNGEDKIVGDQYIPSGDYSKVWVINLTTKKSEEITDKIKSPVLHGCIHGDTLVWSDWNDIYGYDLKTQEKFTISAEPNTIEQYPCIYGDIVVWTYAKGEGGAIIGPSSLRGYNLRTKERFDIPNSFGTTFDYLLSGEFVVWKGVKDDIMKKNTIYCYDLKNGRVFPVLSEEEIIPMSLWNDRLLYFNNATNSIYYYNLTTHSEKFIECSDKLIPPGRIAPLFIHIQGDNIIWLIHEVNNITVKDSLYLYNLTTSRKELVYEKEGPVLEKFEDYCFIDLIGFEEDILLWREVGYYYNPLPSGDFEAYLESSDLYCMQLP